MDDLSDHLVMTRTNDAILVIVLVGLMDILLTTRATNEGNQSIMRRIHTVKKKTKEKTKGKAKARKAKIEEEKEKELKVVIKQ